MWRPIKGQALCKVRGVPTDQMPHHKQINFSLSDSVRSKIATNSKNQKNTKNFHKPQPFLTSNPRWINGVFATALRDSLESSSLSIELLQFKHQIRSTKPQTLNAITEAIEKKKGKSSKNQNRSRRRRRESPVSFRNSSQESIKTASNRSIPKIRIKSPNQNQVTIKETYLFSFINSDEHQIDVDSQDSKLFHSKMVKP